MDILFGLLILGLIIGVALMLFRLAFGLLGLVIAGVVIFFSWVVSKFKKLSLKQVIVGVVSLLVLGYVFVTVGYNIALDEGKSPVVAQVKQELLTRESLWAEANKYRENPLSLDPALNDGAQKRCDDAAKTGTLDHEGWQDYLPSGRRMIGENLAYGYSSAKELVDAWAASPKHNENLKDSDWKFVGYGICSSDKLGTIVFQHFSD